MFTEHDAVYTANLIHHDSKSVMKVIRYGLNIRCFPDEQTVQRCERQIARQQERKTEKPFSIN